MAIYANATKCLLIMDKEEHRKDKKENNIRFSVCRECT